MSIGALLFTVAILTIFSLYPFYLKKYKVTKYKGFWKHMGDLNKTPLRALQFPFFYLLGGIAIIVLIQ